MDNRLYKSTILVLLLSLSTLAVAQESVRVKSDTSQTNSPKYYQFDLEKNRKGSLIEQPELVLPTGNAYALRIESDLSVDLPGVKTSFLSKVDAAVNNIINEVTGNHLNGRKLLEERGLQIDLIELVAPSDTYLQEHTPILAGQPSNITNYHLIAIVDFKPLQAEMKQLWREVMLGDRLVQYIMIASIVLIILFLFRGNQVMRSRDTNRTIRLIVNSAILIATIAALAGVAMMLHWI